MSKPVVAITRPKDRAKKACEIVEKLGGVPILAPTLDLEPVNSESLKNLVKRKDCQQTALLLLRFCTMFVK